MNLEQLVKAAYEHPRYTNTIINHLLVPKYKLNEATIYIESTDYMYTAFGDEVIQFAQTPEEVLRVLQAIGHIFGHIEFEHVPFSDMETNNIVQHLNKYCAQATQHAVIAFLDETIPFDDTSMEHATIVTVEPGVNATGFPMRDYAPKVQRLNIKSADMPSIAHNFPDLIAFHLETGRDLNQTMLFEFFALNRQIREVYTTIIQNKSYLKHINDMLPNLEKLSLENELNIVDIANESIHFQNVRHYQLIFDYYRNVSNVYDIYSGIQFEQLESFNLSTVMDDMVRSTYHSQYSQLATAYKTINSLQISAIQFDRSRLMELVESLPALKTLNVAWEFQLPTAGFSQFLTDDTQLDRVVFSIKYPVSEKWSFEQFQSQLPTQWVVSGVAKIYRFLEMPLNEVTLVRAH